MTIFVTGDKNVGKTTLVNHLFTIFSEYSIGIETKEYQKQKKRIGFFIRKFHTIESFHQKNCIAYISAQNTPIIQKKTFEIKGVELCKHILKSERKICFIDEIGFFEQDCQQYKMVLNQVLSQENKIIIAILRNQDLEFLNQLKIGREVIYLTKQNREAVKEELIKRIGDFI